MSIINMRACEYKDILGVPGKGIHSIRFFGMALVDILLTLLLALVISCLFGYDLTYTFLILVVLGIFLHWFFCVETRLNKWLCLA